MRNTRNQFSLRNVNDTHMRYVSMGEMYELFDSGDANPVYARQHGKARQLIGARLTATASQIMGTGKTVISKGEMEVNAAAKLFPGNRSRTAGMPEYRRLSHVNPRTNRVEEVDFTEKAEAKVGIWPLVGDDKAIRVGPSVDVTAIYTALDLLEQQRLDNSPYRYEQHSTSFGSRYSVAVPR
ncbi:MAG TPA: hypothetical protein VGQ12_15120 [Candidatus Angelobacter sp.]|nr:hypothetical protein [Candidatus Angelobacter sp.]